jgi:hypothetical protein
MSNVRGSAFAGMRWLRGFSIAEPVLCSAMIAPSRTIIS